MKNDFVIGKSFWQTNIENEVLKICEEFKNNLLNSNEYKEYEKYEDEFQKSENDYATKHNKFLYFIICFCLIISFLLIIPFYWNYKKYKELNVNKHNLLDVVSSKKENLKNVKNRLVNFIDLNVYLSKSEKILNYKNMGPITEELIRNINIETDNNFLLDFDSNYNPYGTSWSVWDDRVIIVNKSSQILKKEMIEYTGETTIYEEIDDVQYADTYYATYTHPYYSIEWNSIKNFAFLKPCSNLEFEISKKRNREQNLENDKFNKYFNYKFNDPAQFRMIFTPYKQELDLNELNTEIDNPRMGKIKNFIFNDYKGLFHDDIKSLFADIKNTYNEFILNEYYGIEKFNEQISSCIFKYVKNKYLSIKHVVTTPIFYSENQKTIINDSKSKKYLNYLPHYLLNTHLKFLPIIDKNKSGKYSLVFNNLIKNEILKKENDIRIVRSTFDCLCYKYVTKTKWINKDGVNVPVEYIDCIDKHQPYYLYYFEKNQNILSYSWISAVLSWNNDIASNLDSNVQQKINNLYNEIKLNKDDEKSLYIEIDDKFVVLGTYKKDFDEIAIEKLRKINNVINDLNTNISNNTNKQNN